MHYIRKSLIYSMRKAFLEDAMVEVVYKFDGSLLLVFEKVSRPLNCHSTFLGGHIHIYKHTYIYI